MTEFEEVYKRAIFKFSDFSHLALGQKIRAEMFRRYLLSSIVDFTQASIVSLGFSQMGCGAIDYYYLIDADAYMLLDADGHILTQAGSEKLTKWVFDESLSEEEKEILALGIVYHWLSSKVLNSELMRNVMHNRDYNSYSPANLLRELRELRTIARREQMGRINLYSFRHSDLQNLRTRRT